MSTIKDDIWSAYLAEGILAYEQGDYTKAEQILHGNLQQVEKIVTNRELIRADLLHALANVHRDRDEFAEAQKMYRHALALKRAELGPNKLEELKILKDFATCFLLEGNIQEAIVVEWMLFEIAKRYSKVHRFESNTSLCRLAAMSFAAGRYEEAEKCYRQILQWRRGSGDTKALRKILADYGVICYRLERYPDAEQSFAEALTLCDDDTRELAALSNSLGLAMCAQNKEQQAQRICTNCAEIRSNDCSDRIAEELNELADVYCKNNKFAEARPLCEAAFSVREGSATSIASLLRNYVDLISRLSPCEKTTVIESRVKRLSN